MYTLDNPLENRFFFLLYLPVVQIYRFTKAMYRLFSCHHICMFFDVEYVKSVKQTFIHMKDNVFVPLHFPFKVSDAQRRYHILEVNQVVVVPYLYLDLS